MNTTTSLPEKCDIRPVLRQQLILDAEATQTLSYLCDVLQAPADLPHLARVVDAANEAIGRYSKTLAAPSATFVLIQTRVADLAGQLDHDRTNVQSELEFSLYRRLLRYPGYALCLSLYQAKSSDLDLLHCATGLAIAYAIATGKNVEARFANSIRRSLTPAQFGPANGMQAAPLQWHTAYRKKRIEAARIFEAGSTPDPDGLGSKRIFDTTARYELSRKMRYSPPRQRQAILDRRHQPQPQLLQSANFLVNRASDGDHSALLIILAFCCGVSLRSTKDMPLADHVDDDNWLMILDVDGGLLKTNIASLTPDAAHPPRDATCYRPANKVVVKPLPKCVATLMKAQRIKFPLATTLGELLPAASVVSRQLTLEESQSGMAPSAARFLASAGPFSVGCGIDRLTAAVLINDFSLTPASKLYYCRVRREEIWDASSLLFAALGWGEAVSLSPGLPIGSCIVPTREAMAAWHAWMADEVNALNPGRNSSLDRLITYHNAYARLCASVAVLCLAGREVQEFRFTTDNLNPEPDYCAFNDKWVGIFPGNMNVPINALLRAQLIYWHAHCKALHRRLSKISKHTTTRLQETLVRYFSGETMPLFFEIDQRYRFRSMGSKALTSWWPESLRFSADFGRHFWEVELRDAGIKSSRIDVLLRHVTHGVESQCSTHGDAIADARAAIVTAQDRLLTQLGMRTIPGLSTQV